MKTLVLICFVGLMTVSMARPNEKYTDRYDNVNLDEILANKRLLIPYIKCTLDKGRCSPDAKELKTHIVDALENNCSKCTEWQRSNSRRVLGHLINNEPEYWNQLVDKYDPEKKYSHKYEADLRELKA